MRLHGLMQQTMVPRKIGGIDKPSKCYSPHLNNGLAFNILASLTMMLIDKKNDLTIFKAMGLKNKDLEMTFSLQGLAINIIGGFAGAVIGIFLVVGQSTFGWLTLKGSVVPAYPVELALFDIVGILSVVVGIGGLGSAAMVRYLIRKIVI